MLFTLVETFYPSCYTSGMIHHLQRDILDQLAYAEKLRYADLNTHKLDGNVFTYHLKRLIADNLVQQNTDTSYSLTPTGKTYIVHRYENQDQQAHSIFLVIIRHEDKLLLRKRRVQPMLDYSGFVHGEPVINEPLEQTIVQRTLHKTGIHVHDISVRSSGLIQITDDDTSYSSFSHAIIASATAPDLSLPIKQDDTGHNYWVDQSAISTVDHLLPSCLDLLAHLEGQSSWFHLSYHL